MDNSEVLNREDPVIKDGPIQKDVAPIQDAPTVIEDTSRNIYTSAKTAPTVVAEKDHASEIMNNDQMSKTYNYNSEGDKVYDTSVTTTTTKSSGDKPLSATWDSSYKMGNEYKMQDTDDYSWNKLASDMSQLSYDQEAGQYRAESIAARQEINAAAGKAWDNYFAAKYSAQQTQDKMGWSGGQDQASNLQVQFLQAQTSANMYTQEEAQRYGVESKLAIARKYADANQRALALQYYQDEVNKAISEANLTGCYVPPEASEMFIQQDIANKILKDSNATQQEKDRARAINENCNKYYENLGFQRWETTNDNGQVVTEFYGIKCLQQLTLEETIRNNKINEELQREANQIAEQNKNIAAAGLEQARLEYNLRVAQQNKIESQEIVKYGDKHQVKDSNNYYMDDNNVKQIIPQDTGSNTSLRKYNGTWYYIKQNGTTTKAYEAFNIGK